MIYSKDLNILVGASMTDYSVILNDYQRDELDLTLPIGEYIYVGLYKPFNRLYLEFLEPSEVADASMSLEIYNGQIWQPVDNFLDETINGTRSGFVSWKKRNGWGPSTIQNDNLYWVRFSFSQDFTAKIRAINILFSNDNDLRSELQSLDKYLAQGQKSFAPSHQTVRDDIIQTLRNKGKIKYPHHENSNNNCGHCSTENITKWDLLDIDEVKVASKYFVLEKIFWQASAAPNDKFSERQKQSKIMAEKSFDLLYLSLDENNTGKEDGQMTKLQTIEVIRI